MKYQGSCHCGKVTFDLEASINEVIACNCSMCSRRGALLTFVGEDAFRLKSGEEALTDYQFHKRVIHHTFCKHCGIQPFARGTAPDGKRMVAVNARCLEGVDIEAFKVRHVDGKSF